MFPFLFLKYVMKKVKTGGELCRLIEKTIKEKGNNCDLNFIDTSLITDMSWLFCDSRFNGDISKWRTGNVEDMSNMFCQSNFKGDISKWNTRNVKRMDSMFEDSKFNGDISRWNTGKVENMSYMFEDSMFNRDISKWNVKNVKDMSYMFSYSIFNSDISKWNVSNIDKFNNFGYSRDIYLPVEFRNLDPNKEYIGWKKLRDNMLCRLKIPSSAVKSKGATGKCRCSEAEVLKISNIRGDKENDTGYSIYDSTFKYKVGKTVKPDTVFDKDRWNECGSGIHFFLTREEAINYNLF